MSEKKDQLIRRTDVPPFSIKDEVGYVLGDMAGSFVNLFIDAFFLTFCTYVLGVNSFFMGNLFLFARLFDAINDPIIGSFPDRWLLGKSGDKFKPYIKFAMWFLALANILCFVDVSNFNQTFVHVWIVFSYILFGVSYTGTSMPFGAMANVITTNPDERTKLSRARSIGGTIVGYGFLSIVPWFIWHEDGSAKASGFLMIAVAFAILSIICYLAFLNLTHERVREVKNEDEQNHLPYSKIIKDAVMNRPLVGVMIATVGSLIYITGNSQIGSMMFLEYYGRPEVLSYVNFGGLFALILALPTVPRLAKRFGKKAAMLLGIEFNLALSLFLLLVPIANPIVFAVLWVISSFGQTIFTMLVWAMVSDCLDYHEWKFNYRKDGSLYSIYTFSRKIGSTLAATFASYALGAIGFVSGMNQTAEVAGHIRLLYIAIPIIACILEVIGIGFIFNLNNKDTKKIYEDLNA